MADEYFLSSGQVYQGLLMLIDYSGSLWDESRTIGSRFQGHMLKLNLNI